MIENKKLIEVINTYKAVLFLDADITLQWEEGFQKNKLTEDAYLIFQKCKALGCSCYDIRLMKASLPWQCSDSPCNRWTCSESQPPVKLQNIVLHGGKTDLDLWIEQLISGLQKRNEKGVSGEMLDEKSRKLAKDP